MDFSRFYSKTCLARQRMLSSVLEIAFAKAPPNRAPIGWAEGQKNPATFPIDEISFRLKDSTILSLRNDELNMALKMAQAQGPNNKYYYNKLWPGETADTDCVKSVENRIPELLDKFREMQTYWHSPPSDSWDVIVLNGSQDGLWRIFEALIDRGDAVMIQTPVYFGVVGAIHLLAPDFIGVPQDADGIIPVEVEKICMERISKNKPLPKILYVNPIGANPTGAVLTDERKRELYEIAQKYDFLIIEDDPYFFLHFMDEQPKSFLSMDTDGRVIRLDSGSKIITAGIRFGVVTAHKELIDKLIIHVENTVMHTSNLTQMFVYKLLETWSFERFDQHFKEIQQFYKKKRDLMLDAVEKHLTGLAEWSVPKGGMFLWIKVTRIEEVLQLVTKKFVPNSIFVIPGNAFNYNGAKPDQHLRLCYSFATAEECDKGLSVIANIIREQIKHNNICVV